MPKLLLADDNETLARFTALNLEAGIPGLRVYVALTAAEARYVAVSQQPDVIVLDRRLPDGDGLALHEELRRVLGGARYVLISAEWTPAIRQHAETSEPFAMLTKPCELEEILSTVRRALGALVPERSGRRPASGEPGAAMVLFDRHRVLNRLAALLAGVRAFGSEIRAEAGEREAVLGLVAQYEDHLVEVVREVVDLVQQCPRSLGGGSGAERGRA